MLYISHSLSFLNSRQDSNAKVEYYELFAKRLV